jgi:hypothetical protein
MRYLLGFHDQINPGSGPAAAWPALSATFPESGDTTPKPSAQATYLAGLPRHDDARPTTSHTICLALFSLSASTSRHISRTTQHCPHAHNTPRHGLTKGHAPPRSQYVAPPYHPPSPRVRQQRHVTC